MAGQTSMSLLPLWEQIERFHPSQKETLTAFALSGKAQAGLILSCPVAACAMAMPEIWRRDKRLPMELIESATAEEICKALNLPKWSLVLHPEACAWPIPPNLGDEAMPYSLEQRFDLPPGDQKDEVEFFLRLHAYGETDLLHWYLSQPRSPIRFKAGYADYAAIYYFYSFNPPKALPPLKTTWSASMTLREALHHVTDWMWWILRALEKEKHPDRKAVPDPQKFKGATFVQLITDEQRQADGAIMNNSFENTHYAGIGGPGMYFSVASETGERLNMIVTDPNGKDEILFYGKDFRHPSRELTKIATEWVNEELPRLSPPRPPCPPLEPTPEDRNRLFGPFFERYRTTGVFDIPSNPECFPGLFIHTSGHYVFR